MYDFHLLSALIMIPLKPCGMTMNRTTTQTASLIEHSPQNEPMTRLARAGIYSGDDQGDNTCTRGTHTSDLTEMVIVSRCYLGIAFIQNSTAVSN